MDIALYIAELLQDHEEVGIPGLGTIRRKKTAASYDPATQSFVPPAETYEFKEDEENDDPLLSLHISQVKNISESSADFFTGKFAGTLRQQLTDTGKADLQPIGWLHLEDEKIFLETSATITAIGSFGLPTIPEPGADATETPEQTVNPESTEEAQSEENTAAPLTDDHEAENEPEAVNEENTTLEEPASIAETAVAESAPESEPEPPAAIVAAPEPEGPLFDKIVLNEKGRGNFINQIIQPDETLEEEASGKKWIWIAVTLFVVFLLAAGAYFYNAEVSRKAEAARLQDSLARIRALPPPVVPDIDSTLVKDSLSVADSIANATNNNLADTVAAVDSTAYHIVVAAFKTRKKAEEYIAQKQSTGIKTYIIVRPPWFRVGAGSFKTEAAALKKLIDIKSQLDTGASLLLPKNSLKK